MKIKLYNWCTGEEATDGLGIIHSVNVYLDKLCLCVDVYTKVKATVHNLVESLNFQVENKRFPHAAFTLSTVCKNEDEENVIEVVIYAETVIEEQFLKNPYWFFNYDRELVAMMAQIELDFYEIGTFECKKPQPLPHQVE